MNVESSSCRTSQPAMPPAVDAHAQTPGQADILSSELLLAGRTAVIIDHRGERYMLRATRAGKLILTK